MKKNLRTTISRMILCMTSIMMTFLICSNEVNAASDPSAAPSAPIIRANAKDNALCWINPGATYRSGATLQFYATGDGYGPEEPQELAPTKNSTRYIPTDWIVRSKTSVNPTTTKQVRGSWRKYTEETLGYTHDGNYIPGEYRFIDSFRLSTSNVISIPYSLTVKYRLQIYNGKRWMDNGKKVSKSVDFFIRNVGQNSGSEFSIKNNSKIPLGETVRLNVSGILSKVTFSSSNKNVAKIGKSSGNITALKVGTTTITAKAPAFGQYRAFSKSIKIRVVPKMVNIQTLKSVKKGQLSIKSDAQTAGNTGYDIRYKYPGGKVNTIKIRSSKALNYTIKKLVSGKKYSISVRSYKKIGNTIYSGYYTSWERVQIK